MKQLHLLTDDSLISASNYIEKLEPIFEAGIDVFQLRFKSLQKRVFYQVGKVLKPILKAKKILFLINDHVDIALALDCDGVHIGQDDLPYPVARKLVGRKKVIGLSISSYNEYLNVKHFDCDYFGVGPIFNTQTKKDAKRSMGLNELYKISSQTTTPCIAIGGITGTNTKACIKSGAAGIAVCSSILKANNTYSATIALKEAL